MNISAYLATSGRDDEYIDVIDQLSVFVTDNLEAEEALIIGLDTNESEKSTRRRREAMSKFCNMFSLQSITPEHMNTFHHNNHTSSSRIDHILYFIPQAKNINIEFLENLCKLNNASNLSSHDVIMGKISFQVMRAHASEIDYKHTYTSFEVCKPQ